MQSCKLTIQINKTPSEIFEFVLDPNNTPLWVESFVEEQTNETPTRLGTIYKNVNKDGVWGEYKITEFVPNQMFVMTAADGNYSVRYTLNVVDNDVTELEYYEWVKQGELEEPFTQEALEKLKQVIESN